MRLAACRDDRIVGQEFSQESGRCSTNSFEIDPIATGFRCNYPAHYVEIMAHLATIKLRAIVRSSWETGDESEVVDKIKIYNLEYKHLINRKLFVEVDNIYVKKVFP